MAAYVAQAWSLHGQLPLLLVIAALLGLGKGGVPGFATVATAATVATSPTSIPGGLGLAVALQVPILTMIDISATWLHYKDLDFDTIKVLLPVSFLGMALGQWLDRRLSDSNARLLVGLLLLMILAVQLGKDTIMHLFESSPNESKSSLPHRQSRQKGHADEEELMRAENGSYEPHSNHHQSQLSHRRHAKSPTRSILLDGGNDTAMSHDDNKIHTGNNRKKVSLSRKSKFIWAAVVGIIGGAATMLTNAMGPILNVYLLSVVQLSPSAYIGTRAMFFCFLNCGKVPMRFLAGTLGWSMMPLAGFLGLVSVLGVLGAKPIMLSMSEKNFVRLELAVVAFSGFRLCWMGWFGA